MRCLNYKALKQKLCKRVNTLTRARYTLGCRKTIKLNEEPNTP
ncbi:hypothetical protein HanIR_Chr14g0694111 [Helianthus annuus]|nr:hypothetical protein HanIR_Chr14g0694111 [Helianthus annuus]